MSTRFRTYQAESFDSRFAIWEKQFKEKFEKTRLARSWSFEEFARAASEGDPTNKKAYTAWIMRQWLKMNVRANEDSHRLLEVLSHYDQHKKRYEKRDINQYKRWDDLEQEYLKLENIRTQGEIERDIKKKGTYEVHSIGKWKVIEISTAEAAAYYAKGTRWCTSNKQVCDRYLDEGPLYLILMKKGAGWEKYAQVHPTSGQAMDTSDKRTTIPLEVQPFFIGLYLNENVYFDDRDRANALIEVFSPEALLVDPEIIAEAKDNEGFLWELTYRLYRYWARIPPMTKEWKSLLAKSRYAAANYTFYVLHDRFPEGEPAIALSASNSYTYAQDILKGRFILGEPAIAASAEKQRRKYISMMNFWDEYPDAKLSTLSSTDIAYRPEDYWYFDKKTKRFEFLEDLAREMKALGQELKNVMDIKLADYKDRKRDILNRISDINDERYKWVKQGIVDARRMI